MKKIYKIILCFVVFVFFTNGVYADSYCFDIRYDGWKTVKPGDELEIRVGITGMSFDTEINNFNIDFRFDEDVFEMLEYKPGEVYSIRDGWFINNMSRTFGNNASVKLGIETENNYITGSMFSDSTCSTGDMVVMTTFKLKVKDIEDVTSVITGSDGYSYEKIEFRVHTPSDNNYLKYFKVDGVKWDKAFDKNVYEYNGEVSYGIESVKIIADAIDSNAYVSGVGNRNLRVGNNKYVIVVQSESGKSREYVLNIKRGNASSDTTASVVEVIGDNNKNVELIYNKDSKTYSGKVGYDVWYVNFNVLCNGEGCSVTRLNPKKLEDGKNEIKFTIYAEDGTSDNYKIVIEKEIKNKNSLYVIIGLISFASVSALGIIFYVAKKKIKKI